MAVASPSLRSRNSRFSPLRFAPLIAACALLGTAADVRAQIGGGGGVTPPTPTWYTQSGTDADGTYNVQWYSTTGTLFYFVQERTNGGAWGFSYSVNHPSTIHSVTGKPVGTYDYRVQACGFTLECSPFSSTITITVQAPPPPVPTWASVPSIDYNGSFSITWNTSSGATSYELQRRFGGAPFSTIYSGSSTSRSESSLSPGNWNYRVRACASSCSAWSSIGAVYVKQPPSTPSGLSGPTTDYNGSYTISWNTSHHSTSYQLQRKLGSGSWSQVHSGSSTSRVESSLGAGTYTYRVRGCGPESVCSGWSSTHVTTVQAAPSTPGGLTGPSTDYNGSYTISWNASTNSTSYQLQRRLGSGSWSQIYSGSGTSRAESSLAAGTYSYRVRGCNPESVCSGWSSTHVTTVQAAPSTPGGLTGPTTDYNGSYTVSWNTSTNSTIYRLQRRLGSGSWSQVYSGSGTSRAESSLAAGTYSYRVRGCNPESVCSGWSSTHVTTVQTAPSTPGGLTGPTTDYNGSYTVSWNASTNSTSYQLQRRLGSGSWSQIYSGSGTSRAESSLAAGAYSYRVRGCNPESVCSGWSSTHITTVQAAPSTPGGLTGPTTDYNGSYTVSWNTSTNSTIYRLQRRLGSGSWSQVYSGSGTSRAESSLAAGTYTYRVRGCNPESVCSGWSSTHVTTVQAAPSTPGGLTGPTTDYNGSYTVSWNTSTNSTSYRLERRLGSGSWAQVYSGSATSKAESSLAAGAYSYRVRGCNSESVCSGWSTTHVTTVQAAPSTPTGLTGPSTDEDGNYTILWNGSANSTSYRLERRFNGGGWAQIQSNAATTRAESGLSPATYDYRVRGCNVESVCSSWSATHTTVVPDPTPPQTTWLPTTAADFPDAAVVNPPTLTSDIVGATQGNGGVSGGQASYSIPIVIPPGRKGMQPSVSLNYSSSSGNGVAGVGFGVGGMSSISRCSATAAQDGFTASVQYDANRDRLCLDGQRLMVTSGTYGASGAQYRTELDSFARVTQTGSINGSATYFTVEHKDGRISKYGTNANTRHNASGRNETLTWAIREVQDRSGNTITYAYTDFGNGEYRPDTIRYTGNSGADGDREVSFAYQARQDIRTSYMAGGKTRSSQRLSAIEVRYQTTLVRKYSLTYANSLSTDRSLLRSITECAYKSAIEYCLPDTTFEWQENAPQYATERLQFADPDNLIAGSPGNPGYEVVHENERWLHEVLPHGDQNGDGVKDWANLQVNAEGEVTGTHTNYLANCFRPGNSFTYTCLEADFNADGLTDSFRKWNSKFEIRLDPTGPWINTGLDWAGTPYPATEDTPIGFADFNGDGYVDIAFKQNSKLYVYFHTQNLAAPYSTTNRQWLLDYPFMGGSSAHLHTATINGDMDGNGTPDFVVSLLDFPFGTPGLPRPSYIILTHSQPGGGMSTTTRPITNLVTDTTTNAHFFHDINGDGLTDFLSLRPGQTRLQYRLNKGTDFEPNWTNINITLPVQIGEYALNGNPFEPNDYYMPIMSKILMMDYDGNGISEFLIAGNVLASSCTEILEYVNGLPSFTWYCDEGQYADYQATKYGPIGQPINGGVSDNSVRSYYAYEINEDAAGNLVPTQISTQIVASATQTAAVDATGDGLTDIVTVFGCRLTACEFNTETSSRPGTTQNATYVEGAWINRNLGTATGSERFEGYDLLEAVEDGYDVRNEWTYRPLSSDEYDTTYSDYYETTHAYEAGDPDYFHFTSSMNVVADHRVSNGIGGLNSTKYRYRGAIYNNKGRGFQGFQAIIVEQDIYASGHSLAATDKITRTDFYQKWPLSSQVEQSCTFLVIDNVTDDNPNCASVISKTTTNTIHNVATSGGARFVAIDDQTKEVFDLASRGLLTTQRVERTFDAAGNVTYESNSHEDDWTENETETFTTYHALDWTNWWLNKLHFRTTKTNPVPASVRSVNLPNVPAGLDNLKQVTVEITAYLESQRLPTIVETTANDTPLNSTETTGYNSFGLATSITTTGTDVTGPRTATTTYSNDGTTEATDGYFPFRITNALLHEADQNTDPVFGLPTSQWDANDLLTTTVYDAFGRPTRSTPAGQPTAYRYFLWCGGATTCPTNAKFVVKTLRAGAPESHSYVDQLGRKIRSSVKTFAGTSFINVTSSFDERGNTTFTSQPHDLNAGESATIGTRFLSFDALNRLQSKEMDQANGAVFLTSYTYDGLKTTINASGLNMHRIYNGLAQLVETKNAIDGYTHYAYDGAGNPIVMQDPRGNSVRASYNALGHKESVDDPNMGLKNFAYNALGEVLSELDANGDTVSFDYDALGRVRERKVNGTSTGSWFYDNTAANKGLGLLDYEDSNAQSDGSGLQKHYFYSSGNGRKDLTSVSHRFYTGGNPANATIYNTDYYTDGFYARPMGVRYPGGVGIGFIYNSGGYITQEVDASSTYVIRQINSRDSRNAVISASLTDGALTHTAEYYDATGQMKSIVVSGPAGDVHDLYYEYDTFGNLDYQRTRYAGATSTETFVYDDLHRLTQSTRNLPSGTSQIDYTYDAAGNITSKSDYATLYEYSGSRPNAVSSITKVGGGTVSFDYDANGNMESGDDKDLTYTSFNMPATVMAGGVTASFYYGSDLSRYKQSKSNGETTLYIDKLMEIVTVGSTTDYRHYLGDVAILTKTGALNDPAPGVSYLHRDRLGSLTTITDGNGGGVQALGFDPFGKPRDGDWVDRNPPTLDRAATERGFTGHEHLDDSKLIHMNGRVYDYQLGRFLSVDPVIQAPGNSESLNPYSYIMNNPLAGTDPSGYCATTDKLDECAESLDSGITQQITDEDGGVVGHVGKDSDGNLYITNNGSANGQRAVQSMINSTDRPSGDIDGLGGPDLVSALQDNYDDKGFFGKLAERATNIFSGFNTDAQTVLDDEKFIQDRSEQFCLPDCADGDIDRDHAAMFGDVAGMLGTITPGQIGLNPRALVARRAAAADDTVSSLQSLRVASSGGGSAQRMKFVRYVERGEKVDDLINEGKALTFTTGNEHALVTLANGRRALVSGGPGGITFPMNSIRRLFGHTHPTNAPPSYADQTILNILGQSRQYVVHGWDVTLVRPK